MLLRSLAQSSLTLRPSSARQQQLLLQRATASRPFLQAQTLARLSSAPPPLSASSAKPAPKAEPPGPLLAAPPLSPPLPQIPPNKEAFEREEAASRLKSALAEQKKKPAVSSLKRASSSSKAAAGSPTLTRSASSPHVLTRAPSTKSAQPAAPSNSTNLVRVSPHLVKLSEVLPARNYGAAVMAGLSSAVKAVASIPGLTLRAARWLGESAVAVAREPRLARQWSKEGWETGKHGVEHVVTGFKVLWLDLKTTTRLLSVKVQGARALSRRENQQLARTWKDMQNMVPFLVILIVPFLEFALPVLLKLFPNMLPSSFQTTSQKQELINTVGMQRKELASYIQEMVADVERRVKDKAVSVRARRGAVHGLTLPAVAAAAAVQAPGSAETINALVDFVERSRTHQPLNPASIPLLLKAFSDELTLERMSRTQLQLLCRYMGAPVLGSDDYLRFALLARLRALRADDMQIFAEGVNELTLEELKKAALERGMRAESDDVEAYRAQLSRWIELSVVHNVSPTMLILSRAFAVTADPSASVSNVLQQALQPDILHDALSSAVDKANASELAPEVLAKAKLESIQGQNRLFEKELTDSAGGGGGGAGGKQKKD
jgi:hypothetical protein